MKTVLILRHAKSSWDNSKLADFDRPLNERGRRDAPRMGRLLDQLELVPDLIIASAAKRAATTAELVAIAAGYPGTVRYANELYLSDPETYIELAAEVEDSVNRLMLVGHNPGIEELVSMLAGQDESMPTAALAAFRLPITHWRELNDTTRAELVGVWGRKRFSLRGGRVAG